MNLVPNRGTPSFYFPAFLLGGNVRLPWIATLLTRVVQLKFRSDDW